MIGNLNAGGRVAYGVNGWNNAEFVKGHQKSYRWHLGYQSNN